MQAIVTIGRLEKEKPKVSGIDHLNLATVSFREVARGTSNRPRFLFFPRIMFSGGGSVDHDRLQQILGMEQFILSVPARFSFGKAVSMKFLELFHDIS